MSKVVKWPKILMYGDSLTQFSFSKEGCWASILANELQRKADLIIRGFSGYNTRQCKALLPYLEQDFKDASIAGVFLGANDASIPELNPQQGVPISEYKQNLKEIVNYIEGSSRTSVFMVTPPALDENRFKNQMENKSGESPKTAALTNQYSNACVEVAKEMGVPCVDIHTAMLQRNDWREFLNDGLHFSEKGGEFVASQILPTVSSLLAKGNSIGSINLLLPCWRDVSNEDPESAFKKWFDDSC